MARDSGKKQSFYRGAAGRERADAELARAKAAAEARKEQTNMPFRFRIGVGGTTQFVILDDAPDFFRHEHNLHNPQTDRYDIFTGCTKEWDNCPVCDKTKRESYYALYFTVLDFTEFSTKDGTVHEFSRKLLVVKPAQQKKFIRAYDRAEKDGRTLRGAVFEVTRDGDKDSAIGNDIQFIEYMPEKELQTYTREWKDREGKKHTEDCSEPYNYEDLFEEPNSDELRAIVGGEPPIGSRAHEEKHLGRSSSSRSGRGGNDDDEGNSRGARSERGRSREAEREEVPVTRGSRRGAAPTRGEEDDDDPPRSRRGARTPEKEEDSEPPRARRGARPSSDSQEDTPPSRGSRRQRPPANDEDDDIPY